MSTYARLPVTFAKGEGAVLWDTKGKRYLDAISGIAVCSLGHARQEVAAAICTQAQSLLHTSNLYQIEHQSVLGKKLCQLSGMESVFFANSGAEANEAAIKIARLYGHNQGIEHPVIIVMNGAFHGRTIATVTATANAKAQTGFGPLLAGFERVDYGDTAAVAEIMAHNPDVVAVLVEPVQGEGGVNIPPDDYLPGLRALCDRYNGLLMVDEIQTGMCRTGQWFAFQHSAIQPDVMTLAKALGNGVPIGACLAGGRAQGVFGPGHHGSTFGGNPLACRAARAVIEVMEKEQLAARAAELGDYFIAQFSEQLQGVSGITDIRGKGLMVAIQLERDCGELVAQALEEGLLINVTAGNVVRLLPPLILTQAEADTIIQRVSALIKAFQGEMK
ncbi:MAG: aspartate aminotransferase family protein [Thiothrix nivea]|nr:MAG: aspartate aminotransferase family protein [Thiothrix nivea]